jgi:hypothetical protein
MKESKIINKPNNYKNGPLKTIKDETTPSIVQIKIENSIQVFTKNNTKVFINNIQDGKKNNTEKNDDSPNRMDAFGNLISKGKGKKQKVSFKDFLTKQKLVEILNVEKITYIDDEPSPKENDNVSCTCLIY